MNIADIDKNLKVETDITREGLTFLDVKNEPFSVHGIFYENGQWVRMPEMVSKTVSEGVSLGAKSTAGGRVRFITDSPYVAISAKQNGTPTLPHMPCCGQAGFDLYEKKEGKEIYVKTFIPPFYMNKGFDGVIDFSDVREREITVNFPLYFNVEELYIGIKSGSVLKKAPDYSIKTPVLFYGSSITQGGCASRPGNSYQGFLERKYGFDYINLGFSGNAKGEDAMARYIASLEISAFVYDYDFNAPTAEHLKSTHERFYKIVREAHPDIPTIMMSRPKIYLTKEEIERRDIVYSTYTAAKARGENVYHIFGSELMELCANEGTVDGVHPNDLGFFSMAERVSLEIDKFIDKIR